MQKKKFYSCEDLQGSVYLGPNALRHCCQRFFVNGKMEGDVEIFKVNKGDDISVKDIIKKKKDIIQKLNKKEKTPCDGCPKLQYKNWGHLAEIKLNKISVEAHSKCNARCSYCSEMFYGGLDPNYDIKKTLSKFKEENFLHDNVSIAFGGGEPLLLNNFNEIFSYILNSTSTEFNDIRVYSNSIIYNKLIHKALDKKKIILITSTDCGTQKTFEKVRGVKKGFLSIFNNLKKYNTNKTGRITIKYILTMDNHSEEELVEFVNLIKKFKLENCNFEISMDYKSENLDLKKFISIVKFYNLLKSIGAKYINLDDHVVKRLNKFLSIKGNYENVKKTKILKNLEKFFNREVIVWGTGRYAKELKENSIFLKNTKISFFVDDVNKNKNLFVNKKVFSPRKILESDKPILIASSTYWQNIYEKIIKLGVNKDRIINTLIV